MIFLADDLPNPLPIRLVRMKSFLPRKKINLTRTMGQHSFRALHCRGVVVEVNWFNCSNKKLSYKAFTWMPLPWAIFKIINLIETTQTSLTTLRIETHNVMYMYVDMFPFSCLECAGCGEDIRSGQSLLALEKQWHLWCFTCSKCGCLLSGEYMGRSV